MDVAHIIGYVVGVALFFILFRAIIRYNAKLRGRRWLTEPPHTCSSSETKIGVLDQTTHSPEVRLQDNTTPLRTNQRICRRCGNIYYVDRNYGDYGFCSNINCSYNNNEKE